MTNQTKKTTTAASKSASHPPYKDMVLDAMANCPDRKGATRQFIFRYLEQKYNVSPTPATRGLVKRTFSNLIRSGLVVHPGNNNKARFKVSEAAKKTKKAVPKKKPVAKKSDASASGKAVSKKSPAKKSVAGKKKPVKKAAAKKSSATATKKTKKVGAKKPVAAKKRAPSKKSPKKTVKKPAAKKSAPKKK